MFKILSPPSMVKMTLLSFINRKIQRDEATPVSVPLGQVTVGVTAPDGAFHTQDHGGSEVTASVGHTAVEQGFNPSSLGLPMARDLKGEGMSLHIPHAMSKPSGRLCD